jgi:hypothetical protein
VLAFVSREPQGASWWREQRGTCAAFDRRRYTLPTIKRGLGEAKYAQTFDIDSSELLSVRGGDGTFSTACY